MSLPRTDAERDEWVANAAQRAWSIDGLPKLHLVPELFFDPCPSSVWISGQEGSSTTAELHAIGIYEGAPAKGSKKPEPRVARPVEVAIASTEQPAVLFLMSHDPVMWNLSLDEGARVRGVYLSSYYPSAVVCPAPLEFVLAVRHGPHVYRFGPSPVGERDDGDGKAFQQIEKIARQPLASFQGQYYGERFRVPCTRDRSLVRAVLAKHRAMQSERTGEAPGPYWLVDDDLIVRHGSSEAPIRPNVARIRAVAHDEVEQRFYVVDDHHLYAVERDGRATEISPPDQKFGWLGGVAIDSKRRHLIVSTRWHTGHHLIRDLATGAWTSVEVGVDAPGGLHALAYEPGRDKLLGIVDGGLAAFEPDFRAPIMMPGSEHLDLPGTLIPTPVQVVAFPEGFAVVLVSSGEGDPFRPDRVERARLVDLRTQQVQPLAWNPSWRTGEQPSRDELTDLALDGNAAYSRATGHYPASIGAAELRRDAPRALAHLARRTEGMKCLTAVVGQRHAVFLTREHHGGLVASIAESSEPDWEVRLARSLKELDAPGGMAAYDAAGRAHWLLFTPQARGDMERCDPAARAAILATSPREWADGLPMEGPFERLRVRESSGVKLFYEIRESEVRIASLRARSSGSATEQEADR